MAEINQQNRPKFNKFKPNGEQEQEKWTKMTQNTGPKQCQLSGSADSCSWSRTLQNTGPSRRARRSRNAALSESTKPIESIE